MPPKTTEHICDRANSFIERKNQNVMLLGGEAKAIAVAVICGSIVQACNAFPLAEDAVKDDGKTEFASSFSECQLITIAEDDDLKHVLTLLHDRMVRVFDWRFTIAPAISGADIERRPLRIGRTFLRRRLGMEQEDHETEEDFCLILHSFNPQAIDVMLKPS